MPVFSMLIAPYTPRQAAREVHRWGRHGHSGPADVQVDQVVQPMSAMGPDGCSGDDLLAAGAARFSRFESDGEHETLSMTSCMGA